MSKKTEKFNESEQVKTKSILCSQIRECCSNNKHCLGEKDIKNTGKFVCYVCGPIYT